MTNNQSALKTTISDFRKNIEEYLDKVTNNFETLIINRGKDTGVVVMSLHEYNALITTQHEMSSEANRKRLDTAIEKFQRGEGFSKNLIEDSE